MSSLEFKRYYQNTESTCGPTVIRMLLNFYKVFVTEKQVVDSSKVKKSLEQNGTRIDQLDQSVKSLAPRYTLWYKEDAHINDVAELINKYHIPVAVNWQGLFWNNLLEEARLSSTIYHGHYSIVTAVDFDNDTITLADPYHAFREKDRIFPINWFKSRWWDISDTAGSEIKGYISYYTSRMIFIVYPKNKRLPSSLGLQKVGPDYFRQKIAQARKTLSVHPLFEPGRKKTRFLNFLTSMNRKVMSKFK